MRDVAGRYPGLIWERVHVSAAVLRDQVPDWSSYRTFAFVRNPWDRMVSLHAHIAGRGISFEDFVLSPPWQAEMYIKPQVSYLADERGALLVDFIGKFERLAEDLAFMNPSCERVLLHLNKSQRPADYRDCYTPETQARVGELFRADIETFGYEF